MSLAQATVPYTLKKAIVCPLLKSTTLDADRLENYRPVSTLPFLSKILERIVLLQLSDHLSANDLIDPFQSAYRKHCSTETAIIRVQNDILRALDANRHVVLVLLDLSAAFDTVEHSVLLERLSSRVGIGGSVLNWLKSYLSCRSQQVKIGDDLSSSCTVKYGVPQGSVLGPVLFSLYLLPLGDFLRSQRVPYHIYADDTQLYLTFDNSNAAATFADIERLVELVRSWMCQNFMMLNPSKTEIMIISSRFSCHQPHIFKLDSASNIEPAATVRNLGAKLCSNMSVNDHITTVCRQASASLRSLSRIRKYLDTDTAHTVFRALVLSRIDYHNALLVGAPAYQIRRLQLIQNWAARIIFNASSFDHVTPLLKELHWLPIEARILFKICVLIHRALHGKAPSYISNLIQLYQPARCLRSVNVNALIVPKTKTITYGDRAFSVAGPRAWNVLPTDIRTCVSETAFRRQLKTFLFLKFYS